MAGDTPHDASAPSPASNTPDKPTHATGPESHIPGGQAAKHGGFWALTIGAIGVVFGDIGTSPLYAFRETFANPHHPLPLDNAHILGVISLIFWSMMIVVSVKYVAIIMRADNKGEGGSLALLALVSGRTKNRRWSTGIVLLGVFATALFYGDSMITPAISVLSAVEGLKLVTPAFTPYVLAITIGIIIALFLVQRHGTAAVATFFGPIMVVFFALLALPSPKYTLEPHA